MPVTEFTNRRVVIRLYNIMQFEWDEAKNRTNRAKHGVDFETAAHVFDDPYCVLFEDRIDDEGELRWHAVGLSTFR